MSRRQRSYSPHGHGLVHEKDDGETMEIGRPRKPKGSPADQLPLRGRRFGECPFHHAKVVVPDPAMEPRSGSSQHDRLH